MAKTKCRKTIRLIGHISLAVTAVFIVSIIVCMIVSAGQLEIKLPEGSRADELRPERDIVEIIPEPDNERIITIRAKGKGKVFINYENTGEDLPNERDFEYVDVLPGGVIFDMTNGNFSGYRGITLITQIYVILITALLLISFVLRCKAELFSYSTLFYGGSALFIACLSYSILLAGMGSFNMTYVYSMIKNAGAVMLTTFCPLMLLFSLAITISNIMLIKREGKSFVNMLGIIISTLIVLGYAAFIFIDMAFTGGSEMQTRIFNTATSVFYTAFAYFEMMLAAALLCGIIAAKKKPSYDKTHVIILGCAISSDGTPLPLLRGRIDRAIAFAKEQKAKSGKTVKFVPSGGQGSDEVISEAESMRNYLISQGIDESRIIIENKSVNTQENMRFSLKKITADCAEPSILFSTSGYHVLRSGMISQNEGLDAEGIGAKTKWYFFPNAFVREFIGLLTSKWKQHLFWIVFFIILFAAVNMIIPM